MIFSCWLTGSASAEHYSVARRTGASAGAAWGTARDQLSLETSVLEQYAQRLARLECYFANWFVFFI